LDSEVNNESALPGKPGEKGFC